MAKYRAKEVADYSLGSVEPDSGDNLSNLKLQKLVAYAQGFHLAMKDRAIVRRADRSLGAWARDPFDVARIQSSWFRGPAAPRAVRSCPF